MKFKNGGIKMIKNYEISEAMTIKLDNQLPEKYCS
jgi:hypothetical protein